MAAARREGETLHANIGAVCCWAAAAPAPLLPPVMETPAASAPVFPPHDPRPTSMTTDQDPSGKPGPNRVEVLVAPCLAPGQKTGLVPVVRKRKSVWASLAPDVLPEESSFGEEERPNAVKAPRSSDLPTNELKIFRKYQVDVMYDDIATGTITQTMARGRAPLEPPNRKSKPKGKPSF